MTNNRKLLELAAKACGIEVKPFEMNNVEFQGDYRFIGLMSEQWSRGWFNPITSSADCAAMCAKLMIDTDWSSDVGTVACCASDMKSIGDLLHLTHAVAFGDDDREAAWRYAATQVAAAIAGIDDGPGEEDGPWAAGWEERTGMK